MLGIRGKPSTESLLTRCYGFGPKDLWSNLDDYNICRKVLKEPDEDRKKVLQWELGAPSAINVRLWKEIERVDFATRFKFIIKHNLDKVIKWAVGCRF